MCEVHTSFPDGEVQGSEEVGHTSFLRARSHDIEIAKSPTHRCCSRAAGSPATVSAVRMESKGT